MANPSYLLVLLLTASILLGGCSGAGGGEDAGQSDSGQRDSGPQDAANRDVGDSDIMDTDIGDADIGDADVLDPSCPPADEPASFGRACTVDGQCDAYLTCVDQTCGWPEAMTGTETPGTSQVRFLSENRELGRYHVELALTELQQSRGLAHRPCMQPGWAMLFIHPQEESLSYTVEEMRFAIDLIFADADGRIVAIFADQAPGKTGLIGPETPAKYVVELHAGEAARLGLEAGDRLEQGM